MSSLLAMEMIDGLAARWLPMMLDATIKGAAILAVAGITLLAMRRKSAATRQLVLLIALVGLLIVPVVSLALPGWATIPVLPAWARFEPQAQPAPIAHADPAPIKDEAPPAPAITLPPAPRRIDPAISDPPPANPIAAEPAPPVHVAAVQPAAVKPASSSIQQWFGWGMVAWACGVVLCLLPLVLGRISIWRLRRRAVRITDGPLWDAMARAKAHLRLKGPVTLLVSHRRSMPMMWGIFRAVLLLPAEAVDWSADRLWVVMLHELGHVKRRDMLTKVLAHMAAACYWFNPLVWLAYRQFQTEAERACDDLVLGAGSNPGDYAEHILEIACSCAPSPSTGEGRGEGESGGGVGRFAAHGSIAMARPSRLEGRLLAILDPRRNRRALTRFGLLIAAALVVAIAVPLAIMRADDGQRLENFDLKNPPDGLYEKGIRAANKSHFIEIGGLRFQLSGLRRTEDGAIEASLGIDKGYEVVEVRLFDHEKRKFIRDSHTSGRDSIHRVGQTDKLLIADAGSALPEKLDLWLRVQVSGDGAKIVIPAREGAIASKDGASIVVADLLAGMMSGRPDPANQQRILWDRSTVNAKDSRVTIRGK